MYRILLVLIVITVHCWANKTQQNDPNQYDESVLLSQNSLSHINNKKARQFAPGVYYVIGHYAVTAPHGSVFLLNMPSLCFQVMFFSSNLTVFCSSDCDTCDNAYTK